MTAPVDPLLVALRGLYDEIDPVPEHVVADGIAAFTWSSVDAELLALLTDSALEPVGVRGDTAPRLLTFTGQSGTVEVEVSSDTAGLRLIGFLTPPGEATITVRHLGGESPVRADPAGRFRASGISSGLVSLIVAPDAAGPRVVTEWLPL